MILRHFNRGAERQGRIGSLPAGNGLWSQRAGSVAAEFAIVIPLLLLLMFGIIEFGRAMWVRNWLQSAVEDAARCAALKRPECDTDAEVRSYAVSRAGGVPVTNANFVPSLLSCVNKDGVTVPGKQVKASYSFTSIVPVIPLNLTLEARACRPAPP